MLFFFKAIFGVINWSNTVLSKTPYSKKITRNILQFQTKKCITLTYQKYYTILGQYNVLPEHITTKYKCLAALKKSLLNYYHSFLEINYKVDNPRSWKTIGIKSNPGRDLSKSLSCSF